MLRVPQASTTVGQIRKRRLEMRGEGPTIFVHALDTFQSGQVGGVLVIVLVVVVDIPVVLVPMPVVCVDVILVGPFLDVVQPFSVVP